MNCFILIKEGEKKEQTSFRVTELPIKWQFWVRAMSINSEKPEMGFFLSGTKSKRIRIEGIPQGPTAQTARMQQGRPSRMCVHQGWVQFWWRNKALLGQEEHRKGPLQPEKQRLSSWGKSCSCVGQTLACLRCPRKFLHHWDTSQRAPWEWAHYQQQDGASQVLLAIPDSAWEEEVLAGISWHRLGLQAVAVPSGYQQQPDAFVFKFRCPWLRPFHAHDLSWPPHPGPSWKQCYSVAKLNTT